MITMPITTSIAMNRSRASLTRMMKSNHHQAFRQPCKIGRSAQAALVVVRSPFCDVVL